MIFVVFYIRAFFAEPLMFHLLEFYGSENKIAGGYFVSKRLSYLRNSEGNFRPYGTLNVLEVYEFALRRFGTKVNFILIVFGYASRRFEHQVEISYRRPVEFAAYRAFYFMLVDIRLHLFLTHGVGIDFAF